ncbi:MAG: hypothetical protein IKI25_08340 [Bacteroidales bacterium]|nr:hypothetical protein [Bacteroidales bacterium]
MNYTFTEQEVEILIFPLAITTNNSRLTLLKPNAKMPRSMAGHFSISLY